MRNRIETNLLETANWLEIAKFYLQGCIGNGSYEMEEDEVRIRLLLQSDRVNSINARKRGLI